MKDKKTPIKYYIEYGLIRFIRTFLLCFPVDVASFIMGKTWRFFAPLNSRHKRVLRHMEWALGDDIDENILKNHALNMWENLGCVFCESLISDYIIKNKNRFDISAPTFKHWDEDCQDGTILVTHHYGNWELLAALATLFSNRKVMGIYRRVKNPLVEEFVLNMRASIYKGGLYSRAHGAAKHAVLNLKRGEDISMVTDLRDRYGVTINFFGMPAEVTSFPASLALKFDKPVFAAQLRRTKGVNFVLDIKKIDIEKTGDKHQDELALTQALHHQFEKWIKQDPSQWMWAPYRWSARRDMIKKPQSWVEYQSKQ